MKWKKLFKNDLEESEKSDPEIAHKTETDALNKKVTKFSLIIFFFNLRDLEFLCERSIIIVI